MDEAHLKEGEEHPALGPHYFSARAAADEFMAMFEPEHFGPLVKRFADEFYSKALEHFENFLLSDTESNLQGAIWRGIDDSVEALLSGEKWALERYAINIRSHSGDEIRAAIAKLIPAEIQNARIADLEKEVARLTEQLRFRT